MAYREENNFTGRLDKGSKKGAPSRKEEMRRGIWLGAAVLVAVVAAIPLWLALDDDGSARRSAALAEQTDCSKSEDAEACEALLSQLRQIDARYVTLQEQLDAAAAHIDAWQAKAEASGDAALQSMLEVGPDLVAIKSETDVLSAEIAKWEEELNTVGDDAQLANVDLQNMLQKQQQTLQMMSNISKMLYDTAQGVIRKIGG